MRLSKQIGVSWPTARNMLKMIRTAMAHRDSIYRLGNIIEMDDAVVDGKRPGKSGRSDQGKKDLPCLEQRGSKKADISCTNLKHRALLLTPKKRDLSRRN